MPLRRLYGLWGFLLALGAPLGSLALRTLPNWQGSLLLTWIYEWQRHLYFYLYMSIGTTLAFSAFGYVLGKRTESLHALSIRDGLTGLYNHRYLQETLSSEIDRSDRYATPLTCLMLDIDDFKKINDQYGHPFGDTVLARTARILLDAVRRTDIVGRYGGEEFLVIMPQTTAELAYPIAQRIMKAVQSLQITVSIGLATYPFPEHGVKSKSGLLSAADQALYKAKLGGKNQTVIWRP